MSRSIFGWDLPPGCSNADIDRAFGGGDEDEEVCEICEGTGNIGSDCCNAPINKDYTCSKCREITDPEPCPECKGHFVSRAELRQVEAERRYDELREEGLS